MAYKIEQRLNNTQHTSKKNETHHQETKKQDMSELRTFCGDVEEGLRLNVRKA